jgi:hypothetical protein
MARIRSEGGISPYLILWRGTCASWLSSPNSDPGSNQILTQHYGAQSQTISQLASLGTTPTSPSRLTKQLRMGSVRIPHHILTTRMEPLDFIKPSALYLSIHMELSLRQSFFLRRNLRGYTVGTTARFPVEITEALALQSHHRIPRKCPQYYMSTCSAHHQVIWLQPLTRSRAQGLLSG